MDRGRLFPVAFGYSVQLVEQVPMDEGDVFLPRLVLGGKLFETTET
jgi:5-formyltetrahydrofolate cyclo-ligase